MNITQTLLQNPSFRQDVRKGEFTANDLLNTHCRDWEKKPSVRRVREVVAVAKELDSAQENMPIGKGGENPDFHYGNIDVSEGARPVWLKPNIIGGFTQQDILDGKIETTGYLHSIPKFSIPESTQPVADDFLKLSGDFAIISDLHVPYHSSRTIEKFLDTAYSHNLRKFLIVGDMFDCGQFHPKRGDFQHHNHRYQDDLELGAKILEPFMECFPEGGVVLSGNHPAWFISQMKGELDTDWTYSKFFHKFPKVQWSNYEQCRVTSGEKSFRCTHGANYSGTNPLSVVQRLSAKFEESVIVAHQHHSTQGWSYSGKHQCIALGSACDTSRLSYLHHSPKTNPCQTNGFALLKDGVVTAYDNQEWFK